MHKIAVYPGTFDPITLGHLDIIDRALHLFDEVIVAVASSQSKRPLFTLDQRVDMIEASVKGLDRVRVMSFDNLVVNFCQTHNASIIIRGLRAVSDFEYELQMGYANHSLDDTIESVYLMPSLEHAFISSSVVRTLLEFKGSPTHLVPSPILPLIEKYLCI